MIKRALSAHALRRLRESPAVRAHEFDGMANAGVVVSYRIPLGDIRAVRLHGKVDNLFNREYYESGFRAPRATGLGGLQFEF